ncbi:MAG: hypothetical protein EOO09_20985 [Chitinophagaceae bacterium]|nr:MAG: hypothetical protein EOO09_20985 [Chitinophagaceae bacterium]
MLSSKTYTRLGILLTCFLVSCTGKAPSVKKEYLEVFYKDGVTQANAQELLEFLYPLWRTDGDNTGAKSVQLTKTADTVNFRMVTLPERVSTITAENIGAFIQLMSDTVFDAAPVNLVICDDHFREQKTIRYSENFRKSTAGREARNRELFGTRYHSGTTEVYLQPGVAPAFGNKLAAYFDDSKGQGQVQVSFQVLKEGGGYIVKMATSQEFVNKTADSVFQNMANTLSKEVFDGATVTFVAANTMFDDIKQFKSKEG